MPCVAAVGSSAEATASFLRSVDLLLDGQWLKEVDGVEVFVQVKVGFGVGEPGRWSWRLVGINVCVRVWSRSVF